MSDLFPFLTMSTFSLVLKSIFLLLIGMYAIFVFIIRSHIRSLNKVIIIQKPTGSPLTQAIALFYLLAAISLFFLAVVIL